MTVYNVLGQRVATLYEGTPTAGERRSLDLDARPLPSGTYLVRSRPADTRGRGG